MMVRTMRRAAATPALACLRGFGPTPRQIGGCCTAHKHRNLLAHAPNALHGEISADDTDMIYAATAALSRCGDQPRAGRPER